MTTKEKIRVDFGVYFRPNCDLAIKNDIYKVNYVVNGRTISQTYNKKTNVQNVIDRAKNNYYNGKGYYSLRIKSADYLYNASDYGLNDNRNIQMYIDDELLSGASFVATYSFSIKNVGEVDYIDKLFYYKGEEKNPNENIATINIDEIISYVPNNISYRVDNIQNQNNSWKLTTSKELIDNNKIDNYYKKILETYNSLIVTTKDNQKALKPIIAVSNKDEAQIKVLLQLDTIVDSNFLNANNLIYNNVSEITLLKSKIGRRMAYSIPGNQKMADQSLGKNAPPQAYTNIDEVTPNEVDADSAQKVNVLPPTGTKQNNRLIVIAILMVIVILEAGAILIKKVVLTRNDENKQ